MRLATTGSPRYPLIPCRLSVGLSTSVLFSIGRSGGVSGKCSTSSGYNATTSRGSIALNHVFTQAGVRLPPTSPTPGGKLRIALTANGAPTVTNKGTFQPRGPPSRCTRVYATPGPSEGATTTLSAPAVIAPIIPVSILRRITPLVRYW